MERTCDVAQHGKIDKGPPLGRFSSSLRCNQATRWGLLPEVSSHTREDCISNFALMADIMQSPAIPGVGNEAGFYQNGRNSSRFEQRVSRLLNL